MANLITDHLNIWTAAQAQKGNGGRGRGSNGNGQSPHGIKKLRELILELAVRGKLVPQDPDDEPASVLLERIAKEKAQLVKEGKIKKQKPLPEVREDEKPFDLPGIWEWARLGSISQINPRNEAEDNLATSFIPMPLISTSHRGEHAQEIRVWGEIKKGYTHFADGDIGVAKITPCFENSKAVVFSDLENGIGAGTTELHIARPFGSTLVPRYVLLFLKAPIFLHVGKTKMTGTAGQKRLPKEFFSEHPLPIPPLAEQHRIVAKVDELMALCDQLEQKQTDSNATHATLVETLLATLTNAADQMECAEAWQRVANHFDALFTTEQSIERLKQTILQLAVMGKLVPQNPGDEPVLNLLEHAANEKKVLGEKWNYRNTNKKVISSKLNVKIPKHWALTKIAAFAWIKGGKRMPRGTAFSLNKTPYVYIRVTDMKDLSVSLEDLQYINEEIHELLARYIIKKEDLYIVIVGATIGKVGKVPAELDGAHLTENAAKVVFRHINQDYLLYALQSELIKEQFVKKTQQQAQPKLALERIETTLIPIPPLPEQHRIVAKVDELIAICDTLKARLNYTQTIQIQLADAILKQAVA